MEKDICVVFVCNKKYINKFLETYKQLINIGNYNDDICLIIGDDLLDYNFNDIKIIVKHFPDLYFGEEWNEMNNSIKSYFRKGVWEKKFQFHKFYLFHSFFKKWNYILYIDCGMHIFSNIKPILDEKKEGVLFANRDGLDFEGKYGGLTLRDQFILSFNNDNQKYYFDKLNNNYNLDILSLQTGLLLYDTNLINDDTFSDLINLNKEYPIATKNDQSIISLYFTYIKPVWKQLKRKDENIYYYDSVKCVKEKYIMIKWNTKKYENYGYK